MINYLKQTGKSKIQESVAEYAFLKDLITDGIRNNKPVIVSRSDFDAFGFDIIAQVEGTEEVYKIQLKAYNGKASVWDIHKSLLADPFGMVVVVKITETDNQLHFEYRVLPQEKRALVLSRLPKKAHDKKCKLTMADLIKVPNNEMLLSILNYKQN